MEKIGLENGYTKSNLTTLFFIDVQVIVVNDGYDNGFMLRNPTI